MNEPTEQDLQAEARRLSLAIERDAERIAQARERGIRQAVEWLRADYEYGTGPDWRERGCEWIEQMAAEERMAACKATP